MSAKSYLKKASTMKAINNAVRYGLENLNTVQEAFSLGCVKSHTDSAIITAPKTPAVAR